jgi:hypothetical protein
MLLPVRRLLAPIFAVSIAAGGLAYAAADVTQLDMANQATSEGDTPRGLDAGDLGDLQTGVGETETDELVVDRTGSSGITPTGRSTEGCPEGFTGNHGQFVSGTDERPRNDAAQSPCGKPLTSVQDDDGGEEAASPGSHGRARAQEAKSAEHGNGHAKGHDK